VNKEDGNKRIQQAIVLLLAEKITGRPFESATAVIGPVTANYFSFVFSIKIQASSGLQSLFVKIPKADLRKGSKSILPISNADRLMAEDEVNSLKTLADQWHSDDLGIFWVRLREFIPQYNAVVTDSAEGEIALSLFRRLDLRRRLGSKKDSLRLRGIMARLGSALGRFHQKSARNMVFRMDETLPKLERYCRELESGTGSFLPGKIIRKLNSAAKMKLNALEVPTLKGIDIRNILMDEEERLYLFDPGRIKRTCREADLARFIMTYRILYWGSGLFLPGLKPDVHAEMAFLDGYYTACAPPEPKLLTVYLIKEQLKHWHTAIDSLNLLPWSKPLKRLVASVYVNPYYKRQLTLQMKRAV
jgi:hypothetical protein